MSINIYFAGPLFTHAELCWNVKLASAIHQIDKDLHIFLPQQETRSVFDAIKDSPGTAPDFEKLKNICLNGINSSKVVVAVLDGADADSGTCFECGYAVAKNIPVIGIRTDVRSGEDEGINAMLTRSCHAIIRLDNMTGSDEEINKLAKKICGAARAAVA